MMDSGLVALPILNRVVTKTYLVITRRTCHRRGDGVLVAAINKKGREAHNVTGPEGPLARGSPCTVDTQWFRGCSFPRRNHRLPLNFRHCFAKRDTSSDAPFPYGVHGVPGLSAHPEEKSKVCIRVGKNPPRRFHGRYFRETVTQDRIGT